MELNASETLAARRKERDAYLGGLSDRTRTLCLGALALIWGIFSQKKGDQGIDVSRPWKISLLTVGLAAIVVLVFDFLEYACAYQYRRKLAGEVIRGKFRYGSWEARMRASKIWLGAIALAALCLILVCILAKSVFAEGSPPYPYFGKWCGGPPESYTCLSVSQPQGTLLVKISFRDVDYIPCGDAHEEDNEKLVAECGVAEISASPVEDDTELSLHLQWPDSDSTLELNKQPDD